MKQILRNTGYTDEVTFYSDGTPVDADGSVTVTITDAAGAAIDTDAATNKAGTGNYTINVDPLSDLTILTLDWTGTFSGLQQTVRTSTEVVGAFLFTEADIRGFDNGEYAATDVFTSDMIHTERASVTDLLEAWSGQSWVPRFAEVRLSGDGSDELAVPHHHVSGIIAGWIGDTAMTATELSDVIIDGRILARDTGSWPAGRRNIRLHYEYGRPRLTNGVDRIAMILAASRLSSSNVEYETETLSDDGATVRYTDEIPELRRWLKDHTWRSRSRSVEIR